MKNRINASTRTGLWFKISAALAVSGLLGIWGFWYYRSMTTQSGDINITGIQEANKIYSYSMFADFYFRQISFDSSGEKISEYSELIPVKTNMGYEFKKDQAEFVLHGETSGIPMVVDETSKGNVWTRDEERFINSIRKFSREYGRLLASQDQRVLDDVRSATIKIQQELYGVASDLPQKATTDFLEDARELKVFRLPIDNLRIDIFNLDYIIKRKQDKEAFFVCDPGEWCQDIWKARFNEKDQIYLQYLDQYRYANIDELIERAIEDGDFADNLVIITVMPKVDGIVPIFFAADLKKNKVKSYFLDPNGYAYILVFHAMNQQALTDGLGDFLKISYGVSFQPVAGFNNRFAYTQEKLLASAGNFLMRFFTFRTEYVTLFGDGKLPGIKASFDKELGESDYTFLFDVSKGPRRKAAVSRLVKQGLKPASNGNPIELRFTSIGDFELIFGQITVRKDKELAAIHRAMALLASYKHEVEAALDGVNKSAGWKVWQDDRKVLGELCQDRKCLKEQALEPL